MLVPATYTIVGLEHGERFTRSATLVVGASGGTFHIGVADARNQRVTGTVFADYNYNGRLDAGEASAFTDAGGIYSLATRATNVSLRLLLSVGESISLPYGATSLWLPTVSGTVAGKNIGIR